MKFKVGLAQCRHPENGNVLALVERNAAKARSLGVDLLVFPESLMTRYEESARDFLAAAEPLDGPFARAMDAIAAEHGLWVVYTMNERGQQGAKPFNTAVITGSDGIRRGVYRKVHLFDSVTTAESSRMASGDELFEPIETPFCKIGLCICYDLRFPEAARHQALHGAELLLYPAAWVAGPRKAHQWTALLTARAIENELFVAGVSRSDPGYAGHSCIVDPFGDVLAQAEDGRGLLVSDIDTAKVAEARRAIPVFEHRRPDVY